MDTEDCIFRLTTAQINSMSTGDSEGPAWSKFWMSMDHGDTESMMSGEGSSHILHTPDGRSGMMSPEHGFRPGMDRLDSVLPTDSASHNGIAENDETSALAGAIEDIPFTFKFKAPSGRVHRLQVIASAGLGDLISVVAEKLGGEADGIGGVPAFDDGRLSHTGFALSYLDNEGDTVSITTDSDLVEAITLARQVRKDKVDLFVHDPEKPAIPVTLEPQPAMVPPTPPESQIRRRRAYDDEEDEGEGEARRAVERRATRKSTGAQSKQQEQIIQGVPNDLLLPGALVVLGAVLIITFAVGRASSR